MTQNRLENVGARPVASDPQLLADYLVVLPKQVRLLYSRQARAELDPTPPLLEPAELQVLVALSRQPGLSVGGLADCVGLPSQTVTHALAELNRRGLATSNTDRRDARKRTQRLTHRGRALATRFTRASTRRLDVWSESAGG